MAMVRMIERDLLIVLPPHPGNFNAKSVVSLSFFNITIFLISATADVTRIKAVMQ